MNIAELILSRGEGSAPAVLWEDVVVTYAELRKAVRVLGSGLLAQNHYRGERIGLWSENTPFFVAAYLGIIRAGMVVVPFQPEITEELFEKLVEDAGIGEIFVSQRSADHLRPWADRYGIQLVIEPTRLSSLWLEHQELVRLSSPAAGTHLAALMFTSGSTGVPKGVMITHRNIECNTTDIIEYLQLTPADRVMVVLPFHYCFGVSLLHTHLMAGASLVLNNNFRLYPEAVLEEMQEKQCTGFAGVPSIYQILLRQSRFRQMSFPNLRWFQQAGGKLPNACIEEIRTSFPHVQFYAMYGQTEATARLSYLPPERLGDKLGSIGRGLASTKLTVLRPDGTAVSPGNGETGEIVAEGDNIAAGYWNDPLETAKFFRNGRLHTGDLARVDKDGFVFIVERERDIIKSGGNRVSSKEVEDVIAEIPQVVEVAVVGAPHDLLGECIRAFVVLRPETTLSEVEILAHCRKRLPAFEKPHQVLLVSALPHNSAGKILKQRLKSVPPVGALPSFEVCAQGADALGSNTAAFAQHDTR